MLRTTRPEETTPRVDLHVCTDVREIQRQSVWGRAHFQDSRKMPQRLFLALSSLPVSGTDFGISKDRQRRPQLVYYSENESDLRDMRSENRHRIRYFGLSNDRQRRQRLLRKIKKKNAQGSARDRTRIREECDTRAGNRGEKYIYEKARQQQMKHPTPAPRRPWRDAFLTATLKVGKVGSERRGQHCGRRESRLYVGETPWENGGDPGQRAFGPTYGLGREWGSTCALLGIEKEFGDETGWVTASTSSKTDETWLYPFKRRRGFACILPMLVLLGAWIA
ncbi:hypothetical protein C8F01DRAFT_1082303 [Mycena amicta]|nr:hypothetical protein C8F01DRAFT_1082303 [Mycena amicta]